MPTPSEQKALAFVAIVLLIAGVARVVSAGALSSADPGPAEQQGLARQAFAANSAAVDQRAAKSARPAKGKKQRFVAPKARDGGVHVVGGVESVPFSNVRPDRPSPGSWPESPAGRLGFPPPSPRIDVGRPAGDTTSATPSRRKKPPGSGTAGPVDLDAATEQEIESLPRVGPALARRIVANRDSLGPFRSLEGLRRVKGIGPATLTLIAPHVTFSRQTRP
jgi:hypothetical protein